MSHDDFSSGQSDSRHEEAPPDESGASGPSAASRGRDAIDRRSVLRDLGIAGLAAVGGFALAPSPPTRPGMVATADDGADVPYGGATITTEDETPIARYQYQPDGDGYAPTSPINVVFPLADASVGLPAVMAVLDEAGWTRGVSEYARYAWDRERGDYVHQHATAAETYLGLHGRLHVRCWEFGGVVSMQVHEDTAVRPHHKIATYADARDHVEGLFRRAGWRVTPAAIELANGDSVDHDGRASIVRPAPDATGEGDA